MREQTVHFLVRYLEEAEVGVRISFPSKPRGYFVAAERSASARGVLVSVLRYVSNKNRLSIIWGIACLCSRH